MARLASILGIAVLVAAGSVGPVRPAAATDQWEAIQALPKAQRLPLIISHCRNAVDTGGQESLFWCGKAWGAVAFSRMDARKAEVMFLNRWVIMVDARSIGRVSLRKATPLMADTRLAEARAIAIEAVSLGQGFGDEWDAAAMVRLAAIIGHEPLSGTLMQQRLTLLKAIGPNPRDEASLWVVVALASTWGMEYDDVQITPDVARQHVRDMVALLKPMLPNILRAEGPERAVHSLVAHEIIGLLKRLDDFDGAREIAREAALTCRELLWSRSALCMDISMLESISEESQAIIALYPDRLKRMQRLPVVVKGSLQAESALLENRSCRVVVRFDLDPAGAVINVRIVHSEPLGFCDALAIQMVSRLQYEPLTGSPSETIRTDLLQPVVGRAQ